MPLFERARIEVYLPDVSKPTYSQLLIALESELTYAFGGCTLIQGLEGYYLSRLGTVIRDRVHLLYCDTAFVFRGNLPVISAYADALREAALEALDEEAILVAVHPIYHAQ